MEPRSRNLLVALMALAVAVGSFAVGLLAGSSAAGLGGDRKTGVGVIRDAYEKILETSIDPPSERALTRAAIRGMVEALRRSDDPHALFYSPKGYRSFRELTTGRFSGIGVWVKERGDRVEIVSVLRNSPARKAGLRQKDVIVSIDRRRVAKMTIDEAVVRIKGPQGTKVTLGIKRGDRRLAFTIERESLELPNVQTRLTDGNIGYVNLFGFGRGAGHQLRAGVRRLVDAGAEGVVLDLRNNGGGLFSEAITVASVFIESGEIVTYQDRERDPIVYEAEGDAFEELPLVVLVNEGTASAAEIVAGALQDRGRADLVGATTYGKGSVQEVFPLMDSSALKITTGAYVTPSGRRINGRGIRPDVEVAAAPAQRARAVAILKRALVSSAGARG